MEKPFIKWLGGKTQIIEDVIERFPKKITNYHELFIGGGSVLLALLSKMETNEIEVTGKIYAYDVNPKLIELYNDVKNNSEKLFKILSLYLKVYTECPNGEKGKNNRKPKTLKEAKSSKESYYYWKRDGFNKAQKSLQRSAMFIFLNKTCFRGVYREGPNGFNVPFGHYKSVPKIIDKNRLMKISKMFEKVEFICADFKESIKNCKPSDFVYMDPPYVKETEKSFTGYTKDGFNIEQHTNLFNGIKKLDKRNCKFLLSNSNVSFVNQTFENFKIDIVEAKRAIHSKKASSSKTQEVLISNM